MSHDEPGEESEDETRTPLATATTLLTQELKVVSIGVSTFADDLRAQGIDVVEVDWEPPAGGDTDMLKLLERLGL